MSWNSGTPQEGEQTRCSPVCGDVGWSQCPQLLLNLLQCCSLWRKSPWSVDRGAREVKEAPCWAVHRVPGIVQSTSWCLKRLQKRCITVVNFSMRKLRPRNIREVGQAMHLEGWDLCLHVPKARVGMPLS